VLRSFTDDLTMVQVCHVHLTSDARTRDALRRQHTGLGRLSSHDGTIVQLHDGKR